MNQTHKPTSDKPAGGANSATVSTATGTTAQNMNGWRRPQRERKPSDQEPATGSDAPSAIVAMATPRPVSVPESPSTWL